MPKKTSYLQMAFKECANLIGSNCIITKKTCHVAQGCFYFKESVAPLFDVEKEYGEYMVQVAKVLS